jgi:hypothetical protein
MNCISVDIGQFDFYLRDLADEVIEQEAEQDFFEELHAQFGRSAKSSNDEAEKKFFSDAADKCGQLAKWFGENQP